MKNNHILFTGIVLLGLFSLFFWKKTASQKAQTPPVTQRSPLPRVSPLVYSHPSLTALERVSASEEVLTSFFSQLTSSLPDDEILFPFTSEESALRVLENVASNGRRTVRLKGKEFSGSVDYRYGEEIKLEGYFLNHKNPNRSYTVEGTTLQPILKKALESDIICSALPYWEEPLAAPSADEPLSAPALINTKPDAPAVIYLDFDGETVNPGDNNATSWNSGNEIVVAASAQSDSNIEQICREVAEDFSPWNITVTNDLSVFQAVSPQQRIRVIITPTSDWYGSAGGVAFLNSFDDTTDTPCWVFNTGRNGITEATSHEIGHTLGLYHDGRSTPAEEYYAGHGSGTTGWAPIMGVGYSRNLVQWSKGEYAEANNTQDDLADIEEHLIEAESPSNPLSGYQVDTAGDNIAEAAVLGITGGTAVSQSGIIEKTEDVDYYVFTSGAGSINFSFNANPDEPNLDIQARLLDSGGNVISTNNPESDIDASISATVSAGAYYLAVEGVGKGDVLGTGYSDYGSLGQYTITGTVIDSGGLTPPPVAVLSGITDPALLTTTHTFQVTYQVPNGGSATDILKDSLGNGDLSVEDPSGGTLSVTFLSASPAGVDASPLIATYRVDAPGGDWEVTDAGTYTIKVNSSEINDDEGAYVTASTLGTFYVDGDPPLATLDETKPANIGSGNKQFSITFTDAHDILLSSLNTGSITVSGPGGYAETATFLSATPNSNSTSITATYEVSPPSGTWNIADVGTYEIGLNAGVVSDIGGALMPAETLGSFTVLTTFWLADLDSDPGFSLEGDWAFGVPSGSNNPTSGKTGSNVLATNLSGNYANNQDPTIYATSPTLSTLGYSDVYFSFEKWLGIENSRWDKAYVEYSLDDGASWTVLWENTNTASFQETAWTNECYPLPGADNITTLKVRFGLNSDTSVTYTGWNLDDIALSGVSLGNQAPMVSLDSPIPSAGNKVNLPADVGLIIETSAIDDTLEESALTYIWSQSAGTGTATFSDASSPDPFVTFSEADQYTLNLNVSDGELSTDLSLTVHTGVTSTSPAAPVTTGGIIHYALDEAIGATQASDSFTTDGSNTGSHVGSPTLGEAGVRDSAYRLDGIDDSITIPNSADINTQSHQLRTVALWFKPESLSGRQCIFEEGGATRGLNIYLDGDSLYIGGWNNGENGWNETWLSTKLSDTAWHHVAFILDAPDNATSTTGFKFFLNGLLISEGDGGEINSHTDGIAIGAVNGVTKYHDGDSTASDYFTGHVDDFLLYNRALDASEIAALSGENIGPHISFTSPVTAETSPYLISKAVTDDGFGNTTLSNTGWSAVSTTASSAAGINGDEITFPEAGTYVFRITADDTLIKTFRDLTLIYEGKTPYELWIESFTGYSAPDIDFDKDGVPNLVEFASGGDPTDNSTPLPFTETQRGSDIDGNYVLVTIHQRKTASADGLSYTLQYCSDLIPTSWSSEGVSADGPPVSVDATYEAVTYRIDLGTDPHPDEFFTRYGVELGE